MPFLKQKIEETTRACVICYIDICFYTKTSFISWLEWFNEDLISTNKNHVLFSFQN